MLYNTMSWAGTVIQLYGQIFDRNICMLSNIVATPRSDTADGKEL